MELSEFALQVIAVSASGVLAPGPLLVSNLIYGTRYGISSGLKIAHGHAVVELALVALLGTGVLALATLANQHYFDIISLTGGLALIGFALLQALGVLAPKLWKIPASYLNDRRTPFAAGIFMSAFNPLFLLWWFTVGLKLISDSLAFGQVQGIALMFSFHIWMDYAWLAFTAFFAGSGKGTLIKSKYYPAILLVLAGALVYYGLYFIISSVTKLIS